MDVEQEIASALAEVRQRIAVAAERAGREPGLVTLVAVSKLQPAPRVQAALAAGQRVFGENYVQEARSRWTPLREAHPDLELHLIGPLQTNKTADAVALFDVIQTLDRPKLARSLAKERDRQGRLPRLYVQVNTGEEPQKGGVLPDGLDELLQLCRDELVLAIEGLMAIPPEGEDIAPHTALLAKLAKRHGLAGVSIGMSADYEEAVRFGATTVRVGSSIFGERPPRPASGG
ncbi:YggS family pyridoxal phosphate-dependent enzyme [Geminicoccus harenae]|uniref:YggS family pyridoxal phosphate-dependent enzyme n=2 Tax=Geminicoccus harenae TaxID=2498453 RepID=UPI001C963C97|nr:YggS family pyridoxal phosphate-dependent enzyme [Geminicoccus harenae]